MGVIRKPLFKILISCLLGLGLVLFFWYKLQGTQVFILNINKPDKSKSKIDYFVIQNPPLNKDDLIDLVKRVNDTLKVSRSFYNHYVQIFYNESLSTKSKYSH